MDPAVQDSLGRLANPAQLVSPMQAVNRARAGRRLADWAPAQIHLPQRELPWAPIRVARDPKQFQPATRQRLSAVTLSASAARSTSLPSSFMTERKIIASSNLSGILRRTISV